MGVGAAGWVIPACQLTALHASRQHLYNFVATLFLYCVIVAAAPPRLPHHSHLLPSPLAGINEANGLKCFTAGPTSPSLHPSVGLQEGIGYRYSSVFSFSARVCVIWTVSAAIFPCVPSEWCMGRQSKINGHLLVALTLPIEPITRSFHSREQYNYWQMPHLSFFLLQGSVHYPLHYEEQYLHLPLFRPANSLQGANVSIWQFF